MGKRQGVALGLGVASVALIAIYFARRAGAAPEEPEEPEPGMANLYGRVTNSQTGKGIAGVKVTTTGAITMTDSAGDYAALDIPPGEWGVRFEKAGYETKEVTLDIQEGNNEYNTQLVPEGGEEPEPGMANLYGRVTDQQSGKALSGAKVALGTIFVTTDSNGDYLFFEEPPGEYTLSVTKDGYVGTSFDVELAEGNNEFNIQLAPSAPPEEPEEGIVEITNISVSPTQLTAARHEYETSLGLGYWGDPFTIRITYSNPFDYDVWVKPDYALGQLTGQPLQFVSGSLQGFNAEKLLYFRLLLDIPGYQGDYSYTTSWQKPWDPKGQNISSGLAFVYDPDGVPRAGDERWLKVPAGGSKTTVKEAHLGGDQVKAYKCTLCGTILDYSSIESHYATYHPGVKIAYNYSGWGDVGPWIYDDGMAVEEFNVPAEGVVGFHDLCVVAWRAIYFVYDPGCGQTRVGGKIVIVNWRLEELSPIAHAIESLIEIVPG